MTRSIAGSMDKEQNAYHKSGNQGQGGNSKKFRIFTESMDDVRVRGSALRDKVNKAANANCSKHGSE